MMTTFTKFCLTLLCFCLLLQHPSTAQEVVINEVMSSNTTTLKDEFDAYSDWVELYNTTEEDINLKGYYLTDDANAKQKWQFTKDIIIRSKDRVLVWASDQSPASSGLHTNFKISKEGEPIILSDPNGTLVDELSPVAIPDNQSYGRFPDGSNFWHFFASATPQAANAAPASTVVINEVMASNKTTVANAGGRFEDWIEIYNYGTNPVNLGGFYLSDNSENLTKWQFPNFILDSGAYLLVWASDGDGVIANQLHTNFKIGKEGEAILLTNAAGAVVDRSPAMALGDDESYGRRTDASPEWQVFKKATPNAANAANAANEETTIEIPAYEGIPIVKIYTGGNRIDDQEVKSMVAMQLLNSETFTYPGAGLYNGKIDIKVRGFSSSTFPKKSYSIDLVDEERKGIKRQLLDMPAEEDWALIANYMDKSLMRNYIAYTFSSQLGRYAPRARFVDLYVDDVYEGVYLLVESIKRDKNRVDVEKLTDKAADQVAPNIEGGYLLELMPSGRQGVDKYFTTNRLPDKVLTFKSPKNADVTPAQEAYIRDYVREFEAVLYGDNYKDPVHGYQKHIDVDAFIDYIIVNELARNNDAFMHASVFMYKKRNGKLALGPVWDFDIGFGNINYNDNMLTDGWYIAKSPWIERLFSDAAFANKFIQRMQEIRSTVQALPAQIETTGALLEASANQNFKRWDILGKYVWPNQAPFPDTYQGEVERLKTWVVARTTWIYDNLESLRQLPFPTPQPIIPEAFTFTSWENTAPAASYPEGIMFYTTDAQEGTGSSMLHSQWSGAYSAPAGSGVKGLGEKGLSLVHTAGTAERIGTVLLAINTTGSSTVKLNWTAGTIAPNQALASLHLQYRMGKTGRFVSLLDNNGEPVTYTSKATAGHSKEYEVVLPLELANQPEVQLAWVYYMSEGSTGTGAEIRLDDIRVAPLELAWPVAHNLMCGDYAFTAWDAASEAGTYPASMVLQQTQQENPTLLAEMDGEWVLGYNLSSRSRINGLGESGISFINTGNTQADASAGYTGAAVVALSTLGQQNIRVSWTAGTIAPNSRIYALRLQYRLGNSGPYTDVTDAAGLPVEYVRNETADHEQQFQNVLPESVGNQPLVQLRWKYYAVPSSATGSRAALRLDDIKVTGEVPPITVASSGTALCAGEATELAAPYAENGLYAYQWLHNGAAIEGATAARFMAREAGAYRVQLSAASCTDTTGAVAITVYEKPLTPVIRMTEEGILVASAELENATFSWMMNDEVMAETTASITPVEGATYKVRVTSDAGCTSEFSEVFTYYPTAAEDELPADKALALYPNPTSGRLYIQLSAALAAPTIQVSIINSSGSTVLRKEYHRNTGSIIEIAMEHLPAGLYLVQIATPEKTITKKVLLRH